MCQVISSNFLQIGLNALEYTFVCLDLAFENHIYYTEFPEENQSFYSNALSIPAQRRHP